MQCCLLLLAPPALTAGRRFVPVSRLRLPSPVFRLPSPRMSEPTAYTLLRTDRFVSRHIGPRRDDIQAMVQELGYDTLDAFTDAVVPADIRLPQPLDLPPSRSEREVLQALRGLAAQNRIFRSYLGMGYYGTFTPQVIQRNVLENPGWYTAYTPVSGGDRAGPARGACSTSRPWWPISPACRSPTPRSSMKRPPPPRRCT